MQLLACLAIMVALATVTYSAPTSQSRRLNRLVNNVRRTYNYWRSLPAEVQAAMLLTNEEAAAETNFDLSDILPTNFPFPGGKSEITQAEASAWRYPYYRRYWSTSAPLSAMSETDNLQQQGRAQLLNLCRRYYTANICRRLYNIQPQEAGRADARNVNAALHDELLEEN